MSEQYVTYIGDPDWSGGGPVQQKASSPSS